MNNSKKNLILLVLIGIFVFGTFTSCKMQVNDSISDAFPDTVENMIDIVITSNVDVATGEADTTDETDVAETTGVETDEAETTAPETETVTNDVSTETSMVPETSKIPESTKTPETNNAPVETEAQPAQTKRPLTDEEAAASEAIKNNSDKWKEENPEKYEALLTCRFCGYPKKKCHRFTVAKDCPYCGEWVEKKTCHHCGE